MRAARTQRGFTIVETMIVLAVTGLMFLVAMLAVSGRQNETEFQQGITSIQSALQQIISQINSGDYSTNSDFKCIAGGSGTQTQISYLSGTQEGTSSGCIFLGKVIQFGVAGSPQTYIVYPVAGLRENGATGELCITIACTDPDVVAPGNTTNNTPNFPNASALDTLENGLSVMGGGMYYIDSSGTHHPIGAIGLISTLGSYNSNNQLISGSQQIQLIPITGTTLNMSSLNAVDAINGSPTSAGLTASSSLANPAGGVQLCFVSGTTNQSGLVTIGGNGGSNLDSVSEVIKNDTTC